MTAPDLTPITTLLANYPRLAQADLSPIRRLIEEGCDLKLDIVPVIRFWIGKKKDIYSLGFFARYIRQARDARLNAPPPPTQEERELIRAKNIAWHRKRNLQTLRVGMQDYEWLERYEEKHGLVDA